MLKTIFAAMLLCSAAVFGSPVNDNSTSQLMQCGSTVSDEKLLTMEAHFQANKVGKADVGNTAAAAVPVYFHVIVADDSYDGGNVPDFQLVNQIAVLNANFAGTGVSFYLANIDRTYNPQWFYRADDGTPEQTAMKRQLRLGGANALNVYTVSLSTSRFLGYATFPFDYARNPADDGIVLQFAVLPGGSNVGLNTGKLLVHEAGHWVGLFHTFQGGCYGPGDYVNDTPPEAYEATGCPQRRDTCPGGGDDPIHNHMDYTTDVCRYQFTQGQVDRLRYQVRTYRGIPA